MYACDECVSTVGQAACLSCMVNKNKDIWLILDFACSAVVAIHNVTVVFYCVCLICFNHRAIQVLASSSMQAETACGFRGSAAKATNYCCPLCKSLRPAACPQNWLETRFVGLWLPATRPTCTLTMWFQFQVCYPTSLLQLRATPFNQSRPLSYQVEDSKLQPCSFEKKIQKKYSGFLVIIYSDKKSICMYVVAGNRYFRHSTIKVRFIPLLWIGLI